MKVNLIKLTLYFLVFAAISTGCSSNSPKKAAAAFLNAFNEKNYEEARKYATVETIKLVDLMENLSKMSTSIDSVKHSKIEVLDETITGDSANVTFREAGSEETEEVMLKKIDGKWLVHITKSDISAKDNSIFNNQEEGLMLENEEQDTVATDSTEVLSQ